MQSEHSSIRSAFRCYFVEFSRFYYQWRQAPNRNRIWATAEDLRNSVDGWDFKSYVLGILFYRFISENITNYINRMQREAGDADFDYTSFSDEEAIAAKEDLVREKGFFILPSQLFCNVRKQAKNDPNLNVTLSEIFKAIEASAVGTESEDDLKGLFAI